jgi:hypothetical protein
MERGVHDMQFTDCDVDGKFTGNGDFGIGFEAGSGAVQGVTQLMPVYNITYTNCTSTGFFESGSTSYDNGDGFTAELYASNITFTNCRCLDTWDGCFDLKGGPITITSSTSMRDGMRPFKFWNGPVTISNALVGYNFPALDSTNSNYHHFTQYADGAKGAIWASGFITADKMTFINNEYPVRFDNTGNKSLTYNTGNGTTPTLGAVVTGGTSGAKAKIAGLVGNGTSGTLYIFNGGTFTVNETITDTGGFSGKALQAGTTAIGGNVTITNSILALTSPYVNYNTNAVSESGTGFIFNGVANDLTVFTTGSGNVIWKQGVTGTDPLFAHPDNSGWLGCSNDFDPTLAGYPGVKGYLHNAADTCVYPVGQEPIVCPDCSYVTTSAITFS